MRLAYDTFVFLAPKFFLGIPPLTAPFKSQIALEFVLARHVRCVLTPNTLCKRPLCCAIVTVLLAIVTVHVRCVLAPNPLGIRPLCRAMLDIFLAIVARLVQDARLVLLLPHGLSASWAVAPKGVFILDMPPATWSLGLCAVLRQKQQCNASRKRTAPCSPGAHDHGTT